MGEQTVDPSEGQGSSGPTIRDRRRLDPETGQVRDGSAAEKAAEPDAQADLNGQGGEPEGEKNGTAKEAKAGKKAAHASDAPVDAQPDKPSDAEAESPAEDSAKDDEKTEEVSLDGILSDLDAARSSAAERLSDLQRLQAEFVNYRRRVDRDRDVAKETAIAGVLEALLPVLDDVHLARQHGDLESGPFAAIAEKLESVLQRYGLARYGEAGEEFDPEVHEALMRTEAELAEGTTTTTVVQVLQPGYRSGDRVLRAARVAVADPH
ncbi:nucleotide exchange factor GrpE [Kineosporia sp. J2-2]|uniref:Protein GrpE n=1 Tax=Kineosporia corallincola TaxID=2835133 RepID=A0ABS5TNE8_9ACTN|nr:nucleotide exchange factor GrpE [Kineosporia corallincola]MBT0772623.1 nucleotide exchange factor GrpE [Kineosporia corallincola]